MTDSTKIKEWVNYYSDIVILTPKNNEESLKASHALLLSLRKLDKNATFTEADECPASINKNLETNNKEPQADFLISIKEGGSKLSQLFYEKTNAGLNLFLKTDGKELKKEDIILRPLKQEQLLITVGIDSYEKVPLNLKEKSNFIINIDNKTNNKWFGNINLIAYEKPLEELSFEVVKVLGEMLFEKETEKNLLPLEAASLLKKSFSSLQFNQKLNLLTVKLTHPDFVSTKAQITDIKFILEKLVSGLFPFQELLLLWEQNSSPLAVRGIFYSKSNQGKVRRVSFIFPCQQKNNSLIFKTTEASMEKVELQIISALN